MELDKQKMPSHVAVVMDGNGRWAQARGMKRLEGHRAGAEAGRAVIRTTRKLGIKYLTLYTFSEENWQRPYDEVSGLMRLLNRHLEKEIDELDENGVRLQAIGDTGRLPKTTQKFLSKAMAQTAGNQDLVLSLALSYGGRQEIVKACRDAAAACLDGRMNPDDIDEEVFGRYLYTKDIPDPDLLIRTGGEQRLSNFLLWQIAYTEMVVVPTHWPDFREEEYTRAIFEYQQRQRRFGKTGDQVTSQSESSGD